MAKIVIAGKSDCPYFARAELLGDKLAKNLPDFNLHKIVKTSEEWETFLKDTCDERGWNHKRSPLVWRELIDRGGKGVLLGGANEFQEYAHGYYGIESELVSDDMLKMSKENEAFKTEVDKEEKEFRSLSNPMHICITNANSGMCYSMINAIGKGDVFGKETEISLHLLDDEDNMETLKGVAMEGEDLAHGLLREVTVTSDNRLAFKNCRFIVLLDEVEKTPEEDKSEWIKRNAELFRNYGSIINEVAQKDVKVVVGGNGPINFNVFMMLENISDIPKRNIVAVSRTVENNAKAIVAERLNVNSAGVVDLVVWGNTNGANYIDVSKARVHRYDGAIWGPEWFSLPVVEMIHDDQWLQGEFLELVAKRSERKETALKHPASVSTAAAIFTCLKNLTNGTKTNEIFSLAVCSEGWYDVPDGLVFSFPVTFDSNGDWHIIEDFPVTEENKMKEKIQKLVRDLELEKEVIYPPPHVPTPTPPPTPDIVEQEPKPGSPTGQDNQNNNEANHEETENGDKKESDEELGKDEETKPALEKIEEIGESSAENEENET